MLEFQVQQGIATLTLNRANRGNALAASLVEEMLSALSEACDDPAVLMIVLRGVGKHFCTGFDLSDLERQSDGDLLLRFVRIEMLLASLWHAPKRTVAVASGRTWGAGADLVAACDIRVGDAGTRFRFPGAGFGIVLGTRRLAVRVGEDLARRWVTEATEVSAELALKSGLITELVEPSEQPDRIASLRSEMSVEASVVAGIHRASRVDLRDTDLAHLVRSAAQPGLRERIERYANRSSRTSAS